MNFNREFFERFLIRHRRVLVAVLAATVVWLFASNVAGYTAVVLVTSPVPAGSVVSPESLSIVEVQGSLPEGVITDISQVQNLYANQNLRPGMFLLSSQLSSTGNTSNRFTASLPLEAGDNTLYPTGSSVRVWSLGEEGAFLITENAVVISTEQNVGGNNRVTLTFDEASEFRLMQAFALRLVINQA
jgi:hypothetical protein